MSGTSIGVRRVLGGLLLIAVLLCPAPARCAGDAHNVLVILSGHPGDRWTDGVASGISAALARRDMDAEVFVEYLDARRHLPEQLFNDLRQLFIAKYEHVSMDVIITSGAEGLGFARELRRDLFPGTPLVFCSIDPEDAPVAGAEPGMTGVVREVDVPGTVDLILSLLPATKHIVAVNDSTSTGRANAVRIRRLESNYTDRVDFISLDNMTAGELANSLETLPPDSVVLYMDYFRDRDGRLFSLDEGLTMIAAEAGVPVFVLWDWYVTGPAAGGKVVSSRLQGETAARLALDILDGQAADILPVVEDSPDVVMVNAKGLEGLTADFTGLPEGAVVMGRTFSMAETYGTLFWALAGGGALIFGFIVALFIVSVRRGKRAARMSLVAGEGPAPLILVGADGQVAWTNREAQVLLGYASGELSGMAARSLTVSESGRDPIEELRIGGVESGRLQAVGTVLRKGGERLTCRIIGVVLNERRETLWTMVDVTRHATAVADMERTIQECRDRADLKGREFEQAREARDEERAKRQLAERALLANEQAFAKAVEGLFGQWPMGVAAVGDDLRLMWRNLNFDRLAGAEGWTPGQPIDGLLPEEWVPCLQALSRAMETGEATDEHLLRLERRDGSRVLSYSAVPYRDPAGSMAGALLLVGDATKEAELEQRLAERHRLGVMVGESKAMEQLAASLKNLKDFDGPALVLGEPGTGRDMVAEVIHDTGPHQSGPLVRVDCVAFTEPQLMSELFGHVSGVDGAYRDKAGRLASAQGGTLVLDGIGDLPASVQERLLTYLERGEIIPVGGETPQAVQARIIGIGPADLGERVRSGGFREDLYYRFRPLTVVVPPLRDREGDVRLLVEHFTAQSAARLGKDIQSVADRAMSALVNHPWPGNVRELKQVVENGCLACDGTVVRLRHLPPAFSGGVPQPQPPADSPNRLDKDSVLAALNEAKWNKTKAAELLGISRRHLYRKLDEYGLK